MMVAMAGEVGIRDATASDAAALARIYAPFVTGSIVTFEEEPVLPASFEARLAEVAAAGLPWLVAEVGANVVGYAYASPWRPRRAYRFSVEVTAYVEPGHQRRGIGTSLYATVLPALERRGVHAVLAGIALPNPASVALHERCGFRQAGLLREVGFKLGRRIDVGIWQRVFGEGSGPA
jgi:L-amino acid N-acyltransferase YncA